MKNLWPLILIGLGVWIMNEKAYNKSVELKEKGILQGTYHTVDSLESQAKNNQTPETPNVWNIYLLGKIIEDMNRKNIKENAGKRTSHLL